MPDLFTQLEASWPALLVRSSTSFGRWQLTEPALADVADLAAAAAGIRDAGPGRYTERDLLLLALLRRVETGPDPDLAGQVLTILLVPACRSLAAQIAGDLDPGEAPSVVVVELWHVLTHQRRWLPENLLWQLVRELRRRVFRAMEGRRADVAGPVVDSDLVAIVVDEHGPAAPVPSDELVALVRGAVNDHTLDPIDARLLLEHWVRGGTGGVPSARCRGAQDRLVGALAAAA